MSDFPKYSLKSKLGLSYLKRAWNDIEVFVEDKTCSNMWIYIINRALKNIAKIESVIQLGNKYEVIKTCLEDNDCSYPKVYIIDGDFDFIFESLPKHERLFQLKVYCVENLLLSEPALIEIIFRLKSNSNLAKRELKKDLNFISICKHIEENWWEWYILAIIIKHYDDLDNINVDLIPNSTEFINRSNNSVLFDDKRINKIIKNIKSQILKQISENELKERIGYIKEILSKKNIDILRIISGKSCIIPFIFHLLREKYNYRDNIDPLKVELSNFTEFDLDKGFCISLKQKCLKEIQRVQKVNKEVSLG